LGEFEVNLKISWFYKIELHNNATYFMCLVAFGGFVGYLTINNKIYLNNGN